MKRASLVLAAATSAALLLLPHAARANVAAVTLEPISSSSHSGGGLYDEQITSGGYVGPWTWSTSSSQISPGAEDLIAIVIQQQTYYSTPYNTGAFRIYTRDDIYYDFANSWLTSTLGQTISLADALSTWTWAVVPHVHNAYSIYTTDGDPVTHLFPDFAVAAVTLNYSFTAPVPGPGTPPVPAVLPEPESHALLLIGLGLMAIAARRRKL
jgi:hypothetical protein